MRTFLQEFRVSFDVAFNAVNSLATQLQPNSTRLVLRMTRVGYCFTATLYVCCTTEPTLSGNFRKQDFISDGRHVWIVIRTELDKAGTCSILEQC